MTEFGNGAFAGNSGDAGIVVFFQDVALSVEVRSFLSGLERRVKAGTPFVRYLGQLPLSRSSEGAEDPSLS